MGDNKQDRWSLDLRTLFQAAGALSLILYGAGFIVVNSHLASLGIQSFQFIETRYVMAGSLLIFTLAVYAALVGRRIFHLTGDLTEILYQFQ